MEPHFLPPPALSRDFFWANHSCSCSLSEYGCNKVRPRAFNEVLSLYSSQMSPVYSGGLVYEYSQEESNYGLVSIDGDTITEQGDYQNLKSQLAKAVSPSGDGGYKTNLAASKCPSKSNTWDVTGDNLPAIPGPAKKFMTDGAGRGAGLQGEGSQNAGTASQGTATPGSGQVSGTASAKNAAGAVQIPAMGAAPFVISAIVLASTLLGAALI